MKTAFILQILNTIPDDEKMLGRSRPRTALRAFPVDHANNPLTIDRKIELILDRQVKLIHL